MRRNEFFATLQEKTKWFSFIKSIWEGITKYMFDELMTGLNFTIKDIVVILSKKHRNDISNAKIIFFQKYFLKKVY